jgi:hypothetical protein
MGSPTSNVQRVLAVLTASSDETRRAPPRRVELSPRSSLCSHGCLHEYTEVLTGQATFTRQGGFDTRSGKRIDECAAPRYATPKPRGFG